MNKNAEDPRKALKNFKPLENGKECVSVTDEELIGSVQSEDLTRKLVTLALYFVSKKNIFQLVRVIFSRLEIIEI